MLLKLYKFTPDSNEYWETWDEAPDRYLVHWGELGTRGQSKIVEAPNSVQARQKIEKQIEAARANGFVEIPIEDHAVLVIEYAIEGMWGVDGDLEKRYRLQDRMNQTLGWTGLGECEGGSIGSGRMDVDCRVVDYEIAESVIDADLVDTEFENYFRIYNESAC